MIRTNIGITGMIRLTGLALAVSTLAACEDGAAFLQPKDKPAQSGTAGPVKTTKSEQRDVESPETFQTTEAALWDGRPSLGGVWVAHPDVTDPQRVIIRNMANNKSVVGALFRRERDNPGPRLQASSDAAEALSMLAGAPVQLSVTALVRETVQEEPQVEEVAAAPEEAPEIEETTLDPIAGAAAAIEASEPAPAAATSAPADATIDADTETPEPVAEPKAKKGFQWPWAKPKATEPLSAIDAAAVAAAPAAATTRSSLDKPYLQIGIFNVEKNARTAADQIRKAGLTPTIHEQSANDKKFWRVVVGPSQTKSDQSAALKKVQAAGFSDAYATTN